MFPVPIFLEKAWFCVPDFDSYQQEQKQLSCDCDPMQTSFGC